MIPVDNPPGQGRLNPMRIAISGSSGFLGRALADRMTAAGHHVVPLRRGQARADAPEGGISWDPIRGRLDPELLAGIDAVVHLAGEPIGQRWTQERRRRIRESRMRGTDTIARAMAASGNPSMVLLSMSGIDIYGDRGNEVLDERSSVGGGFLADVAIAWERATQPAREAGLRVVHLRTSLVVAGHGGALPRMLPFFRLGLGGRLGDGLQWMSWIALEDYTRCVLFVLEARDAEGPINVTAPHPVRNADFTRILARSLGRPAVLPVPALALRLAYGEMATSTLLASRRALPARLGELGFRFRFPLLAEALAFELAGDAPELPVSRSTHPDGR